MMALNSPLGMQQQGMLGQVPQPSRMAQLGSTLGNNINSAFDSPLMDFGLGMLANNAGGQSLGQAIGGAGLTALQRMAFKKKQKQEDEEREAVSKYRAAQLKQIERDEQTEASIAEHLATGDIQTPEGKRKMAGLLAQSGKLDLAFELGGYGGKEQNRYVRTHTDPSTGRILGELPDGTLEQMPGSQAGLAPRAASEPPMWQVAYQEYRRRGMSHEDAMDIATGQIVPGTDALGNSVLINRAQGNSSQIAGMSPHLGGGGEAMLGGPASGGGVPMLGTPATAAPAAAPAPVAGGPTGVFNAVDEGVGLKSAAKAGINATVGQALGKDLFPENTRARQELAVTAQSLKEAMKFNTVLSVSEQKALGALIPSPDELFTSPAQARTKLTTLHQKLTTKAEELRASAGSGQVTVQEAGKLLNLASEVERQLRQMGSPGAAAAAPAIGQMNMDQLLQLRGAGNLSQEQGEAAFLRYQELQRGGGQ